MKLNKTFGRIATTLVATAMLASVAAVPAFAADGVVEGSIEEPITSITLTKELLVPTGVTVPEVTYEFSIQNATPGTDDTHDVLIDDKNYEMPVKAGVGGSANVLDTAYFNDDETTASDYTGVDRVTKTIELPLTSIADDFKDAGIYKYTIHEDIFVGDSSSALESSDDYLVGETMDLYLIVGRSGADYKITGAVVENSYGTKSDTFTNYYKVEKPDDEETDPTAELGSLSISKTVTGQMGDYSEDFEFTVSGLNNNTKYNIRYTNTPSGTTRGDSVTTDGSGNAVVSVKHGEKVTIYGVSPKEDVYTVSEDSEVFTAEGYTLDALTANDNDTDSTDTINWNSTDNATDLAGAQTNGVTVDVNKSATTELSFTNNRVAVSPTGLIMDIAPYVLLVVAAAAGCFVFLRKRRED